MDRLADTQTRFIQTFLLHLRRLIKILYIQNLFFFSTTLAILDIIYRPQSMCLP
jgi:hypothetical protein